jgi:ABC-type multidrug transport system fused ATPase/permease subunit
MVKHDQKDVCAPFIPATADVAMWPCFFPHGSSLTCESITPYLPIPRLIASNPNFLQVVFALFFGGGHVMAGKISGQDLTTFVLYVEMVGSAAYMVVDQWASLMEALGSSSEVFKMIDMPPAQQLVTPGTQCGKGFKDVLSGVVSGFLAYVVVSQWLRLWRHWVRAQQIIDMPPACGLITPGKESRCADKEFCHFF